MKEVADFGPIYAETDMSRFPVEPFNTISNVFFLAIVIYWALQIKKIKDPSFRRYLKVGLPILFVGYVGGSIYHGTRSHDIWLILDFVPIILLAFVSSIYLWKKVVGSTWKVVLLVILTGVIPRSLVQFLFSQSPHRISIGYVALSIPVLLPMILWEIKNKWKGSTDLLLALLCLSVAVFFRVMDSSSFVHTSIPVGTHWLWHSFGAGSTHLLVCYLYKNTLSE